MKMKLITRDTDYAVRALRYMAKRKKCMVTTKDLVRNLKIPRPFLRKILQRLNKKGILKSCKGKGGGFLLARNPDKIFVSTLINIFQGSMFLNTHLFRKKACPYKRVCILKKKLDRIEKYVISELKAISIASLTK